MDALAQRGVARDRTIYSTAEWNRIEFFRRFHAPLGRCSSLTGVLAIPAKPPHAQITLIRSHARSYEDRAEQQIGRLLRVLAMADAALARPLVPSALHEEPMVIQVRLTDRQRMLCRLLVLGRTNLQIAKACSISPHTVRNHLAGLFNRFGVANRTELVARLLKPGSAPR